MTPQSIEIRGRPIDERTDDLHERLTDILLETRQDDEPFASADARAEFQHIWLGRYFLNAESLIWVAYDAERLPVGYILVQTNALTPADWRTDYPYYRSFQALLEDYPAHLHINIREGYRGSGLGARLLEQACTATAEAGAPGIHLITAADARNVGFYLANGFREVARETSDKTRVMLARSFIS